jgi:hypothetical protein
MGQELMRQKDKKEGSTLSENQNINAADVGEALGAGPRRLARAPILAT